MRKETGTYIVKFYDNLTSPIETRTAPNYQVAKQQAEAHAETGGSAVVSRVLYNTLEPRMKLN